MMYSSWDTEWDRQIFLLFWAIFCPFTSPLMIPNIKILKKTLEILSFYINMCTINEDQMIYSSWNIRCDRLKFLLFWVIFCPFSPLTTWKIKILTLKKIPGDIILLHICTLNDSHMMYDPWDMEHDRHKFLSFWTVFCPFIPTYQPRKSRFWKNETNTWRYYHFKNVYHEWQSYNVWFLRYGVQRTEFFVILDHFLSFYPQQALTNLILNDVGWCTHVLHYFVC